MKFVLGKGKSYPRSTLGELALHSFYSTLTASVYMAHFTLSFHFPDSLEGQTKVTTFPHMNTL